MSLFTLTDNMLTTALNNYATTDKDNPYPLDPPGYAKRVEQLESQGLTTSDAQGIADMEWLRYGSFKDD